MKLGRVRRNNTQDMLFDLLDRHSGLAAVTIVSLVYPQSKQPEKKAATFTKHLRRLQRLGKVHEFKGAWFVVKNSHPGRPRSPDRGIRLCA